MILTSPSLLLFATDLHHLTCKQTLAFCFPPPFPPMNPSTSPMKLALYRDGGIHRDHLVAKDSSGNGNDLPLVTPPLRQDVSISQVGVSDCTEAFWLVPSLSMAGPRYVQIQRTEERCLLFEIPECESVILVESRKANTQMCRSLQMMSFYCEMPDTSVPLSNASQIQTNVARQAFLHLPAG